MVLQGLILDLSLRFRRGTVEKLLPPTKEDTHSLQKKIHHYCFVPITKYFMLELLSELESTINSLPIRFDSEKFIKHLL